MGTCDLIIHIIWGCLKVWHKASDDNLKDIDVTAHVSVGSINDSEGWKYVEPSGFGESNQTKMDKLYCSNLSHYKNVLFYR